MARKKKTTSEKSEPVMLKKDFRVEEKVWNRIRILAKEYAGGNASKWIKYAALNAPRKYLVKRDCR
jgi:hypothetical protein